MGEINWTPSQRKAIEASGISLAVSAAAGSGKTSVLTRRITERVCSGTADVSRLLVVTFTRAAAAELVTRIEKALSEESVKNPSDKRLIRQMLLLPSAKISTIDGFCLDLIRENFQDTGISGFGVLDADAEKIMKLDIADELISDYYDGNVSKENEISDFPKFSDTLGSPSSDNALAPVTVKLHDFYSGCVNREKAIKDPPENAEFHLSFWGKAIYGIASELARHYMNFFDTALKTIRASEGASGWEAAFEADYDLCRVLYNKLFLGAPYEDIREYLSDFESRSVKCGQVKSQFKTPELEYFKNIRDKKFKKELAELRKNFFSCTGDMLKKALSETESLQNDLIKFFREYDRRLSDEKKRRHMLGFSDIERIALDLLYDSDNDCPTAAAKEISLRFDEVYIDEYQDTNELQNKIFTLIARENNLFTVGDIKQSIYDFRGAEPSIFTAQLDSRKKYGEQNGDKAAKLFLSENFRSADKVINLTNAVFSTIMNTDGKISYGDDEKLVCGKTKLISPLPEMHIVCKSDENPSLTEAAVAAEKISALISSGEVKAGDIAVLIPTGAYASDIAAELEKRGVPCRNGTAKEFFQSPEVLLALSLLNTIDNPSRDVYLAATLKSPLYGVTLDELIYIRRCKKTGSLYSALKAFTEKTGFAKGKRFLSDHEQFRSRAKICTCGELVREVYSKTKITALCGGDKTGVNTNLCRLYDYARSFESGGSRGLYAFISFIDELIDTDSKVDMSGFGGGADAVRIMTVHGSKGLEFDTVFFCDTSRGFNRDSAKDNAVAVRGMPLAPRIYENAKRIETPMRRAATEIQFSRQSEEKCRLLYVALTRAKRRLVITGSCDEKNAKKYDFTDPSSECSLRRSIFSAYARKKCKSMLDLICTGLSEHPELCSIDFITELDKAEKPQTKTEEKNAGTYAEGRYLAEKRLDFVYPHELLSRIPSKLSVSKLFPDVLDEKDDSAKTDALPAPSEPIVPVFIAGESDSGASRGTAMHTFMQFFDFGYVDKFGVKAEIKRLAENKFLFSGDSEKLNVRKLERFFASPLATLMRDAEILYREKRFIIFYPAESFSEDEKTKEALKGERLMVQGVIDCAAKTKNGELILIDYKTDFFPDETGEDEIKKILAERHSRQLGYYKYACRELFGKSPDHTYIYSFALDGTVEI